MGQPAVLSPASFSRGNPVPPKASRHYAVMGQACADKKYISSTITENEGVWGGVCAWGWGGLSKRPPAVASVRLRAAGLKSDHVEAGANMQEMKANHRAKRGECDERVNFHLAGRMEGEPVRNVFVLWVRFNLVTLLCQTRPPRQPSAVATATADKRFHLEWLNYKLFVLLRNKKNDSSVFVFFFF